MRIFLFHKSFHWIIYIVLNVFRLSRRKIKNIDKNLKFSRIENVQNTRLKVVQRVIMREGWGGIVEPSGVALVWRYPPTSEWITGRTIYSKPLSGGALQIYERRRPFNRLAQSSLTAVVKPRFPRLSSTPLSVTLTSSIPLRFLPRLGSALPLRSHVSPLFYTKASQSDLVLILKGMSWPQYVIGMPNLSDMAAIPVLSETTFGQLRVRVVSLPNYNYAY